MSDNVSILRSYFVAKNTFLIKKEASKIAQKDFNLVCWESVNMYMKSKPRRFRNWLITQPSVNYGCKGHLLR